MPGLRREELAQLAGVSPTYYTRLEQGNGRNVSTEVLDATESDLGGYKDVAVAVKNSREMALLPYTSTAR